MTHERLVRRAAEFARDHVFVIIACALACLVYLRLVNAPFLSWDDDKNISLNPYYLYTSPWRLWVEPYFGMYVPVMSSIWAGLFKLGSGSAVEFRLYNTLVHVLNTVLLAKLLSGWFARRSLSGSATQMAIGIGVTVFALHPLQTAAVGWISGGRDLTATAFALGAVLVAGREGRGRFALASVLFGLGLLCKPSIAGIPLAVIAHDFFLDRPRLGNTVRRMSVWCALVVAVAVATSLMQSEMAHVTVALWQRPVVAIDAIGFYVLKLAWPASLSGDYGRTPSLILERIALLVPTLAAVAVVALALWRARKHAQVQAWSVGWLLLTLPVLGLMPFAFQRISTVADHYMYLPMAAVAGLVAVATQALRRNRAIALWIVLTGTLAGASWMRLDVWRSTESFFTDALLKNPRSSSALTNLSQFACGRGEYEWGLQLARRALTVNPSEAAARANEAFCLYRSRRYKEVVDLLPQLREPDLYFSLDHNDAAAASLANTLAGALLELGDAEGGARMLCQAQAVLPHDPDLKENLSAVTKELAARGMDVRCPQRKPWRDALASP